MGRDSRGRFVKGDPEARELGSKGGKIGGVFTGGNFFNDRERAAKAGRKGGKKSRRGSTRREMIRQDDKISLENYPLDYEELPGTPKKRRRK